MTEQTGPRQTGRQAEPRPPRWSRRRVLALGLAPAALLAGGIAGLDLVSRGVLPGRSMLQVLDGACSVTVPPLAYSPVGPSYSGTFYSAARRRTVGYTIAYPPRHRPGDELPLVAADLPMSEVLLVMTNRSFGCVAVTDAAGCGRQAAKGAATGAVR